MDSKPLSMLVLILMCIVSNLAKVVDFMIIAVQGPKLILFQRCYSQHGCPKQKFGHQKGRGQMKEASFFAMVHNMSIRCHTSFPTPLLTMVKPQHATWPLNTSLWMGNLVQNKSLNCFITCEWPKGLQLGVLQLCLGLKSITVTLWLTPLTFLTSS